MDVFSLLLFICHCFIFFSRYFGEQKSNSETKRRRTYKRKRVHFGSPPNSHTHIARIYSTCVGVKSVLTKCARARAANLSHEFDAKSCYILKSLFLSCCYLLPFFIFILLQCRYHFHAYNRYILPEYAAEAQYENVVVSTRLCKCG